METSILIARLIAPIMVLTGLVLLFNPKAMQETAREFLASRALIYIGGFLALLGGLAIINTHNLWVAGWPVIITIFGWLAIVGGIVRMAFPALTRSIGEAMLEREILWRVSGGLQLALGAYLMVMGYR
jgi:uncharacterized protein YjeT (DUF2065 family)